MANDAKMCRTAYIDLRETLARKLDQERVKFGTLEESRAIAKSRGRMLAIEEVITDVDRAFMKAGYQSLKEFKA